MSFLSEDDIEKILLEQFGTLGYARLPDSVIGKKTHVASSSPHMDGAA